MYYGGKKKKEKKSQSLSNQIPAVKNIHDAVGGMESLNAISSTWGGNQTL